jgi:hypothetical protein
VVKKRKRPKKAPQNTTSEIVRAEHGHFVAGAGSPNPGGRPKVVKQAMGDLLALGPDVVTGIKAAVKKKQPWALQMWWAKFAPSVKSPSDLLALLMLVEAEEQGAGFDWSRLNADQTRQLRDLVRIATTPVEAKTVQTSGQPEVKSNGDQT